MEATVVTAAVAEDDGVLLFLAGKLSFMLMLTASDDTDEQLGTEYASFSTGAEIDTISSKKIKLKIDNL